MGPGDALLSGLGGLSYLLDTPGALLRGGLGNARDLLTGTDKQKGWRASGRDLLEQFGAVGPNTDQGWMPDSGDLAGFAAEMVLDPTNWVGAGLVKSAASKVAKIKAANKLSQKMRAAGALPEEAIQHMHPSMLESPGVPKKMYHGTPKTGIEAKDLDPEFIGSRTDQGYYGKGVYFTPDAERAGNYASSRTGDDGSVIQAYLDVRKPFVGTGPAPTHGPKPWGDGPRPDFYDDMVNAGMPRFVHPTRGNPSHSRHVPLPDDYTGQITDAMKTKGYDASFPDPIPQYGHTFPDRMAGDEIAVFDKSQIHSPYVAPALQDVPPAVRRRLEALAAYNAMARAGGLRE